MRKKAADLSEASLESEVPSLTGIRIQFSFWLIVKFDSFLSVLCVLVLQGADLNAKDKKNKSPLHCACWKGQTETVQYLIDMNAQVSPTVRFFCCQRERERGRERAREREGERVRERGEREGETD